MRNIITFKKKTRVVLKHFSCSFCFLFIIHNKLTFMQTLFVRNPSLFAQGVVLCDNAWCIQKSNVALGRCTGAWRHWPGEAALCRLAHRHHPRGQPYTLPVIGVFVCVFWCVFLCVFCGGWRGFAFFFCILSILASFYFGFFVWVLPDDLFHSIYHY